MSNLCSTQFNLPDLGFKDLAKAVPDEHIFDEEKNTGREDEPHLSVLFGITENNPEAVRRLTQDHNVGPVTITLGKTELFKNEKFNVLKVHVEGQDLHNLHDLIKENIPNEEKFPDYNPHVTLAYLQKGHGPAWEGDTRWEGKRLTLSNLLFSDPNRKKTQIPLTGNKMKKEANKVEDNYFGEATKQGLIWGGAATAASLLSAKMTGSSKALPTSLVEGALAGGAGALSTFVGPAKKESRENLREGLDKKFKMKKQANKQQEDPIVGTRLKALAGGIAAGLGASIVNRSRLSSPGSLLAGTLGAGATYGLDRLTKKYQRTKIRSKMKDRKNLEKKGRWTSETSPDNSYMLGVYSARQGENNKGVATLNNVGASAATAGAIGAGIKATTGQPTSSIIKDLAKGNKLDIKGYQKRVGINDALKEFSGGVFNTKGGPSNLRNSLGKVKWRKVAPNAVKGALIAGGTVAAGKAGLNRLLYNTGKTVSERDMKKEAKLKKNEETGKWEVWTSDESRVLGTHESKEKALKQERAIWASKSASMTKKAQLALEKLALNTNLTHLKPLLRRVRDAGGRITRKPPYEGAGKVPVLHTTPDLGKNKMTGSVYKGLSSGLTNANKTVKGLDDPKIYIPKGQNLWDKMTNPFSSKKGVEAGIAHELGHLEGLQQGVGRKVKDSVQGRGTISTARRAEDVMKAERDASRRGMKILEDTNPNLDRKKINKTLSQGYNSYRTPDLLNKYPKFKEKGVSNRKILGKFIKELRKKDRF